MPEFPEVRTTVLGLRRKVVGKRVVSIWLDWPLLIAPALIASFRKRVAGKKIAAVGQLGKNIVFSLAGGRGEKTLLIIHQRMTGHLLVGRWERKGKSWQSIPPGPLREKVNGHIHFLLGLGGGDMIALSDVRKLARIAISAPSDLKTPGCLKLGPQPTDPQFTPSYLSRVCHQRRVSAKSLLMDQRVVAGIGNIYSSEILWYAKIYPARLASSLTPQEIKSIFRALKAVLRKAISLRGSSFSDYRDVDGRRGKYMSRCAVYRREGSPCLRCGSKIKRIKIGGRSSYFCPRCQAAL